MRAIELVANRETRQPAKEEATEILNACHQRGLLILPAGTYGNVIRFHLPLTATDEQIEEGMGVADAALTLTSQQQQQIVI
jgi:4-aminobutyrate aminotransferase-like enzyme